MPEPGGVADSGGALHVSGGGFTSWGSGIGVSLHWDLGVNQVCAYDASVWDGVGFWAKGNVATFTLALPELDVVPVEEGGRCSSNCYGSHRLDVALDECWRYYALTFEELEAVSWGGETGPVDPRELTAVQFYVEGSATSDNRFEYWVDELAFFSGPKPDRDPICASAAADTAMP